MREPIRGWSGLFLLLLFCFLTVACGPAAREKTENTHTVKDVRGTETRVPARARRVLSFGTGTDEVLLGLLETDRMIAVNENFIDPERSNVAELARRVPNRIPRNPSVETVAALKPDLVFVQQWIPLEKVAAMRDLGIPVVTVKTPRNVEDVRETVRLMAESVGEKERGERLVAMMDGELSALAERIDRAAGARKGATVALVSVMPGYGGAGSMIDDMCRYAGARNAKALAGIRNGEPMTKEEFIASNPDFIFLPSYDNPETKEQKYGAEYMGDPSLAVMAAVREGHIRYPWAHYIYNISQNVVFGVQETARMLYGEAFAQPRDRHLSAVPEKKDG